MISVEHFCADEEMSLGESRRCKLSLPREAFARHSPSFGAPLQGQTQETQMTQRTQKKERAIFCVI
jgi:hypothetical protein